MNIFPEPTLGKIPLSSVKALAPKFAALAQEVYDAWDQIDGFDEELGEGGICHLIADKIADRLVSMGLEDVQSVQAAVGENHIYLIVSLEDGVYTIDIPPGVYETGGGYTWLKKQGVSFAADDVVILKLEGPLTSDEFRDRYCEFG
jgi:hypothetical protein